MTATTKTIIKMAATGGLLAVAVAMTISRMPYLTAIGEEGLQVWFYDQSEHELYTVPRETIPPHKGVGGKKNDGVKAIVVAGRGDCDDPQKRRIAFLESCTPDYKQLMEDVRAARTAGRDCDRPIPEAESGYYEKNTLVRQVHDPTWYDMTTAEARQIVARWQSERGSNGQTLDVCTP
jgi:hypothetical protein